MRRLHALVLICFLAAGSRAQKYCNEWIDHSQKYFKFPVYKEGIYKIDSVTLSKYFNLASVDPRNFQVFIRGKEQFLYVFGEGDGKVNTGDFIEFYTDARSAPVDSLIYDNITYQPNPYTSLFNDTLYAFITLNSSLSNKRFTLETDTNSVAYPAAAYFYEQELRTGGYDYNRVAAFSDNGSDPVYTQAEGRGGSMYYDPNASPVQITQAIHFAALNIYTVNPALPAYIVYNASGMGIADQFVDHRYLVMYTNASSNVVTLTDTTFKGCLPIRQTYTLNPQNFGNSCTISFSPSPSLQFASTNNNEILHYVMLQYPHTLNFNNDYLHTLYVPDSPGPGKGFYNFSGFSAGSSVELLDLSNGRYIKTVIAGSMLRAVIPNGGGSKRCVLVRSDSAYFVKSLLPVERTGYFTDYKQQSANKPYVIVYNGKLVSSANSYKTYRQSPYGGSYDVVMAEAAKLYEQFSYGVNDHPLAIKNFIKFLTDSLPAKPRYILLIGHGVHPEEVRQGGFYSSENLLPAFGVPGSDQLYTSTITGTNVYEPEIAIGRLPALSNADIENYLAKVKQHEAAPDGEWKKKVLHFVGGDDQNLVATLSNYMDDYSHAISDTLFGGSVTTFKKNTTAPIQTNISDSVFNIIDNGCSILTFFGHGSLKSLDQAIDDPFRYNNSGRYPFFIANSCNSGDIYFGGTRSVSENFVFSNQKGSIAFIAPASFGQDYMLYEYTRQLYKSIALTSYGKGLGDAVKEAVVNTIKLGQYEKLTSLDMAYNGDPALRINPGSLPDYEVANNDVSFDLKKYTDSVGINIIYKNTGSATSKSIAMKVRRLFPNNDSSVVFINIPAPYYKDTLSLFMPIDFNRGIGLNRFSVDIDHFNRVTEKSESNNSTAGTVDLFITGGDIFPVYPFKFAIVPKTSNITLKASTSDPFAPYTTYRLQLDTCDKFANPIQSTIIGSKGGVVEWNVNLPFADSTVYFWRVSRDSTSPAKPFEWHESSFQTIGNKQGWGQAHFNQFKTDGYQFVKYRSDLRKFSFQNTTNNIACRDGVMPNIYPYAINYYFNSIRMSEASCAFDGWNVVVFDSINAQPKRISTTLTPPVWNQDSSCLCVNSLPYYCFGTLTYCGIKPFTADLEKLINSVPNNDYILAFTVGALTPTYAGVSTYANSLYNAFESFGAVTIRTVSDTVPYILFGRKGMSAGQGHELVGKTKKSIIYLEDSIKTRWRNGYIASEKIGPSYKWNSLHWRISSLESTPGDTTILKVVGFNINGQTDTLATFTKDSLDVGDLGNYANAKTYPYLQLVAYMRDNVNTTSPQLKRWQVLYDEAAECAINPVKGFSSINDTVQEGGEVTFRFPIENIGSRSFDDSLAITHWIEDNAHNKVPLPDHIRKGPFVPGQLIIDTVKVDSRQLVGNNGLWINVNPYNHRNYQKEQYLFNNIGRYTFKVDGDVTNPLLDVTFDGIRILNGDIVSAKPNIFITLKDENKFLALNDTGAFIIRLQAPGQSQPQQIYFAQGLLFTPANLPNNSCSIQYNPALLTDGRYTLMVQARDRSNNLSGRQDYRIQFEISNKPTVTGVLNYPNPFTTSTRFVFTLTGSEIPEVFTIRIMTISGKVVREITRDELGHLHIGRNITDYAWDGRDNFGDRLARGVYLYHVITRLNGQTMEKSASGADKYFVKEYGKMVLLW